jgi:hypothetical protein
MLSMCVYVPDVLVCGMFGCFTNIPNKQLDVVSQTYQINNLTTQTSREGSNSTKHERRPPEDGQTIVTGTCSVLMMRFTNIFNNLEF